MWIKQDEKISIINTVHNAAILALEEEPFFNKETHPFTLHCENSQRMKATAYKYEWRNVKVILKTKTII